MTSHSQGELVPTVVETYDSISKIIVKQPFALHSTALKWIRDSNEDPKGTPITERVVLTDKDPLMIGVLARSKGMSYSFVRGEQQPWSWRQMLASFPEATRRKILGFGSNDGLVSISCEPLPGSYDHKRHHAARAAGEPFPEGGAQAPIWDFVVRRADGMAVRFHPQLTNKKVEIASIKRQPLSEPPAAGKGMSDGPGTYRRFKDAAYGGLDEVQQIPVPAAVDDTKSSLPSSAVAEVGPASNVANVEHRGTHVGGASSSWEGGRLAASTTANVQHRGTSTGGASSTWEGSRLAATCPAGSVFTEAAVLRAGPAARSSGEVVHAWTAASSSGAVSSSQNQGLRSAADAPRLEYPSREDRWQSWDRKSWEDESWQNHDWRAAATWSQRWNYADSMPQHSQDGWKRNTWQ